MLNLKIFKLLFLQFLLLAIKLIKPEETKAPSGGPFSKLESGATKVQRQVSFRIQRKSILRKTFVTNDKWKDAARRVKMRTQVI